MSLGGQRGVAACVFAGFVLACGGGVQQGDRPVDPPQRGIVARAPVTALDTTILTLARRVSPLDSAFLVVPERLRPDSGTTRADSILLEVQAALVDRTREVAATFNDSALQVQLWPNGARGQQYQRAQESAGEFRPPDPLVADSIRRFLLDQGIWPEEEEGHGYFTLSLARLASVASPFITGAAREALRIQVVEQVARTGSDASVGIPWDSLGERLAATDRFLVDFPDSRAGATVEKYRLRYLRAYLTGWENTSVFDRRTRVLRPEVRRSFERFVDAHGTTVSGQVVRTYLDLLAKAEYRRTAEIVEFLRLRSGIPRHP